MTTPELVIKKGSNQELYIFPIEDEKGNPRDLTGLQVTLYIIDRFSRQTLLTKILTQVAGTGNEHIFSWETAEADVEVGFFDGEIWLTSGGGYKEAYDAFPVVVKDARAETTPDKSFENWLSS